MAQKKVKTVNLYSYCRVSSDSQLSNTSLEVQISKIKKSIQKWDLQCNDISFNYIGGESVSERATAKDSQKVLTKLLQQIRKDKNGALIVSDIDRFSRRVELAVIAEDKGLDVYGCDYGFKPIPYDELIEEIHLASKEPRRILRRTCVPLAAAWKDENKFLYQRGKYRTEIDSNGNAVQVPKVGKKEVERSAYNRKQRTIGDTITGNQNRQIYNLIVEMRSKGKTYLQIGQHLDSNIELYPINSLFKNDARFREAHNLPYTNKELGTMLASGEMSNKEYLDYKEAEKKAKNKELDMRGWVTSKEKIGKNGKIKTVFEPNRVVALFRNFNGQNGKLKSGERLQVINGVLYFGTDKRINDFINLVIDDNVKSLRYIANAFNEKGVKSKEGGMFYAVTIARLREEIAMQKEQMQQSCINAVQ